MNTPAGRPLYCENCGTWLGSSTTPPDPGIPIRIICPDCLSKTAGAAARDEAKRTARDEQPSELVLIAGAATAAAAGLLALMLRELRNSR